MDYLFTRHPAVPVSIAVLTVVIVYALSTLPDVSLWQVTADAPAYAGALLQHENPALFPRDTLFGEGRFGAALWASSSLFLRMVQTAYHVSGDHAGLAFWGAGAFSLGLYVLAAYALLSTQIARRWLALLLAVTTSLWAGFLGLPSGLFAGWGCVLTACILQGWWLPGLRREPVQAWRVLLAGLLVSFSVPLVSATNTLMVLIFTLVAGGTLALLRRLPWWSLAVYGVGLLPVAAFVLLGTGGIKSVSPAGAEVIVAAVNEYYFPEFPFLFGSIYLLLTGICLVKLRHALQESQRFWMTLLIVSQILLWIVTARSVSEFVLIGMYLTQRLWRKQWNALDAALMFGVSMAFMGDWLRMGIYAGWLLTGWTWLVTPLFETFRLYRLAFFGLLLLTGKAIATLVENVAGKTQIFMALVLAVLQGLTLQTFDALPRPAGIQALAGTVLLATAFALITLPRWRPHFRAVTARSWQLWAALMTGLLVLILSGLWLKTEGLYPAVALAAVIVAGSIGTAVLALLTYRDRRGQLIAGLTGIFVLLVLTNLVPQQAMRTVQGSQARLANLLALPRTERDALTVSPAISDEMREYEALMAWIQVNTPPDSLFHATQVKRDVFRFMAQRSLLIIQSDVTFTVISATDPADAKALYDQAVQQTPDTLTDFAVRYDVDYLLTDAGTALTSTRYEGKTCTPQPVYQGTYHWLYQIVCEATA